jgi:hypothetical protein
MRYAGMFERKPQTITPEEIPLSFDPGRLLAVRGRVLIFESALFDLNTLQLRPAFRGTPPGMTESAATGPAGVTLRRGLLPFDDKSVLEYGTYGAGENFITGLWLVTENDQHSRLITQEKEFRLIQPRNGREPGFYAAVVTKDRGVVLTKFTVDPITRTELHQHLHEGATYFNPTSNIVLVACMVGTGYGASSCWQIYVYGENGKRDVIPFGNTIRLSHIVDLGRGLALVSEWRHGVYLCLDTSNWPVKVVFRASIERCKATGAGEIINGAATDDNEVILLESQRDLLIFKYVDSTLDVARVKLNVTDKDDEFCFDAAPKTFAYDTASNMLYFKQENLYRIPVAQLRSMMSEDPGSL